MSAEILSGKISLAPYSAAIVYDQRKFLQVGNSSVLSLASAESVKELTDFQDPSGGVAASLRKIDSVTGQIDFRDLSAANLATALWGTTATLGTTAITGETHKINAGAFIPTVRLINTSVAPVVKKGATVILTADYTVSKGGIKIASTITTGSVADGDTITIDYTPVASADVQAMINTAPLMSLFFEGVNQVDGKYSTLKVWQIKLGAPKNISMIGEDYATLSLEFTVVKDTTIVSGSQYYRLEKES